jgi:hypothetical protein
MSCSGLALFGSFLVEALPLIAISLMLGAAVFLLLGVVKLPSVTDRHH